MCCTPQRRSACGRLSQTSCGAPSALRETSRSCTCGHFTQHAALVSSTPLTSLQGWWPQCWHRCRRPSRRRRDRRHHFCRCSLAHHTLGRHHCCQSDTRRHCHAARRTACDGDTPSPRHCGAANVLLRVPSAARGSQRMMRRVDGQAVPELMVPPEEGWRKGGAHTHLAAREKWSLSSL